MVEVGFSRKWKSSIAGTTFADAQRVLVVGDGDPLLGRQGRAAVTRNLMRLATPAALRRSPRRTARSFGPRGWSRASLGLLVVGTRATAVLVRLTRLRKARKRLGATSVRCRDARLQVPAERRVQGAGQATQRDVRGAADGKVEVIAHQRKPSDTHVKRVTSTPSSESASSRPSWWSPTPTATATS